MHAVVRETTYPAGTPLGDRPEFQAFQQAHSALRGYRGTIALAGDR